MTTKNGFSAGRTYSLLKKQIIENWKVLLMRLILMLGVLITIDIIIAWANFSEYKDDMENGIGLYSREANEIVGEYITVFSTFALFFFGCIMASLAMDSMKNKAGRISTLMTPATQLEKYLSRWIIAVPAFIVLFLGCFYIADLTRCLFTIALNPEFAEMVSPVDLSTILRRDYYEDGDGEIFFGVYLTIYVFIVLQSFFVLGSTIWPRNSLIKTFTALTIIQTVYAVVIAIWASYMNNHYIIDEPFDGMTDIDWIIIWGIAAGAVAIFNYVLSYFRFKEMEIIQRM